MTLPLAKEGAAQVAGSTAGFDDGHLPKPISPAQLVQMLARLVVPSPPGALAAGTDAEALPG